MALLLYLARLLLPQEEVLAAFKVLTEKLVDQAVVEDTKTEQEAWGLLAKVTLEEMAYGNNHTEVAVAVGLLLLVKTLLHLKQEMAVMAHGYNLMVLT
jgi:hypothetical protein